MVLKDWIDSENALQKKILDITPKIVVFFYDILE